MRTNMEMLQLAAKAEGREIHGFVDMLVAQPGHKAGGLVVGNASGGSSLWNPMEDNGDAFLLSLNCQIGVWRDDDVMYIGQRRVQLRENDDASAIARREIVFIAAEQGAKLGEAC